MRAPRRFIAKLLLFLLAGAIINVAVAWGCALLVDPTKVVFAETSLLGSETESWRVDRIDRFGITWIQSAWGRGSPQVVGASHGGVSPRELSPAWGKMREPDPRLAAIDLVASGGRAAQVRCVLGAGWPMRSLWCQVDNQVGGMTTSTNDGMRGAIDVGFEGWQTTRVYPRVLPVLPNWRGFLVNSLVYAAIVWLLFAAPFALRRKQRLRRGLCVKCGYALRGNASGVCSECGAAAGR